MKPLKNRAFELDVLRGIALFMMMLHHFAFDLRYIMNLDVLGFIESWWFDNLLRPIFLGVFLIVSGICCSFTRSNTKRGLRLLGFALLITGLTFVVSYFAGEEFYILFNILHLIAVGTLIYSGLTFGERRDGRQRNWINVVLLLGAAILFWVYSLLPAVPAVNDYWLLPFGVLPGNYLGMLDYLPLVPWLGLFAIGAVIGRVAYATKTTAFPNTPNWLVSTSRPFGFIGRNSLVVYAVHQPILIAILFGLRALGLF